MPSIIILAHNIRSTHNIGSVFRTAEGFGVDKIICSGYTPYPELPGDLRLPHLKRKLTDAISKTALGAERLVPFEYTDNAPVCLAELRRIGYRLVALEQADDSIALPAYRPPEKIVLIIGEEVNGIPADLLAHAQDIVEIPMYGQKESFNVSVAAGIALYYMRHSAQLAPRSRG